MNRKSERYQELDALRGIACVLVMFFHFTNGNPEAIIEFRVGATGVDLFFMISGFVIFMSFEKITKGSEFIINRFSRLYPTYWSAVTVTFLILLADLLIKTGKFDQNLFKQYLGNMTMFQYYLSIPNLDGPYWTMIIEMLFYIGMLILFQSHLLKYINYIGLALLLLINWATLFEYEHIYTKTAVEWIPLLPYIPLFFAGIVFYNIYKEKSQLIFRYAMLLLCFLTQAYFFNYYGISKNFMSHTAYIAILTVYFLIFILFVNHKLGFIVNKTSLFLGKISFALYLVHQTMSLVYINPFMYQHIAFIPFWIRILLITMPINILVASTITFFIEIPMRKKLKSALSGKYSVWFTSALILLFISVLYYIN